jgi:hypothetical protein
MGGGLLMRVLIAVEGCVAHSDRFRTIHETWASADAGLDLRPGFPMRWMLQFFDGPMLGVPDDYLSLPQKTRAICRWVLDDGDYDYMLLVDTDTYLSIPRALASGFENYDYSGYVQTWLPVPYCSGPSYWLSRKAIQVLVETNWKQFEVAGHATDEDVMVGSVLFHRGIRYHHDDRYVSQIPVLPTNNVISEHLSFTGPYTHEKMYAAHKAAIDGR